MSSKMLAGAVDVLNGNLAGSWNALTGFSGKFGGFSGLLDTYTGAVAAYSLRKLVTTAPTNAVRVRRSTDNTEVNVQFDSSNKVSANSPIEQAELGSNRAGVILFDGVDDDILANAILLPTSDFTLTIKAFVTLYPSSSATIFGQGTGSGAGRTVLQIQDDGQLFVFMNGVGAFTTTNTFNLNEVNTIVFSRSGNDYSLTLNGGTASTQSSSNSPQQTFSQIGDGYSGDNFSGSIQSLTVGGVTWDGTQSDALSKSWTVNGSPELSVVVPATLGTFISEASSPDITVHTWYDQTGNGRHGVQLTAANQPSLALSGTLRDNLKFDGINDSLSVNSTVSTSIPFGDGTVAAVHKSESAGRTSSYIYNGATNSSPRHLIGSNSAGNFLIYRGASASGSQQDTNLNNYIGIFDNSSGFVNVGQLYVRGSLVASTTSMTTAAFDSDTMSIGNYGGLHDNLHELILWSDPDVGNNNRTAIDADVETYYGIS